MAGVVPSRGKTSGRKQWTLHDGPRGSLRRLRKELASEGCAESQVILAKQLLEEECEFDIDKKDNAKLGVYWLIKASEQGNMEATDLLNKCLLTGRGITEHNFLDVKSCINMTQDEKIARKAAREMFASLSNGEDFITSEQLQKRMLEIQSEEKTHHKCPEQLNNELENNTTVNNVHHELEGSGDNTNWASRQEGNNEKLTEDHLVAAAADYSHGQLPLVNQVLSLTPPDMNALNHIPYVQRSILHPFLTLMILYCKIVKFLGDKSFLGRFRLSRSDVALLSLVVYTVFSARCLSLLLPTALYYASFFTMVVTTFQMLKTNRDYKDFHMWSGLFLSYADSHFSPHEAEFQFVRNNLGPHMKFFAALLVNLTMFPMICDQWMPHAEITVIAFFSTFVTLLSFMPKERTGSPKLLMLSSFALNVLAKYPYDIDPVVTQGWRFLDLKIPSYVSYVIGNGIEFCLNFHLFFYVLIPVVFVYIAHQDKWRGTYKFLIPHCVTLSWLQIVVINSRGISMFYLLRSTLALACVVLFIPLFGITTVLLPAAATLKWLFTANVLFNVALYLLIVACYWGLSWLLSQTRFVRYISYVQVLLGIIAACLLLNPAISQSNSSMNFERKVMLSWEQYQNMCHQPAWDSSNLANTQIKCQKLLDVSINWTGYVNEIKLASVKNTWVKMFGKMPSFAENTLSCYFGDGKDTDCDKLQKEDCELLQVVKPDEKCSLDKYNVHEFDISVRMQSGIWGKSAELIILADQPFINFTLQLKPNDKIWFSGGLVNNERAGPDGLLGGTKPHIKLKEIGCLACHNMNLTHFKVDEHKQSDFIVAFDMFMTAFKFIMNILFNPVVVIK